MRCDHIRRPARQARVLCLAMLLWAVPGHAAVFDVAPGDVPGLIAAIEAANANGQDDTINISGTYTLTSVNNTIDGPNGLPSITSAITLRGENDAAIVRSAASGIPAFRILHVTTTGTLTIDSVSIAQGLLEPSGSAPAETAAGIFSLGDLTIANSAITRNVAADNVGGISAASAGSVVTITNSIIAGNGTPSGQTIGGIVACCLVSISNTTIADNFGVGLSVAGLDENGEIQPDVEARIVNTSIVRNHSVGRIGGVLAAGQVAIVNSSILENTGGSGAQDAAAVFLHSGVLSLINDTIANNSTPSLDSLSTGGILADPLNNGRIELVNTILTGNTKRGVADDCGGAAITSSGHNIIGTTAGCTISLLPTDHVGSALLGPFTDDGAPGHAHYPLLADSPAIDGGDNTVCTSNPVLATDQIGQLRVGICDIGAIEFQTGVVFAGTPGNANCRGRSISALVRQYGGLPAAASALAFDSVQALQEAVRAFCAGQSDDSARSPQRLP